MIESKTSKPRSDAATDESTVLKILVTPSQIKRTARKEAFRKIGESIRDYHSGLESHWKIKGKPIQDRNLSSRLEGPQMRSQQWERTAKS